MSHLTHEQLADFNYSETMARFKMLHEMKIRGMRGKFNGYNKHGTPRHYNFGTSHISRRIYKEAGKIESTASNVEIPSISEEDLYSGLRSAVLASDRLLKHL